MIACVRGKALRVLLVLFTALAAFFAPIAFPELTVMKCRLRSALFAFACLAWSGAASAHFPLVPDPATDRWFTVSSGEVCQPANTKRNYPAPCEPNYASAFEACAATGAQRLWGLTNIVVLGPYGDAPGRGAACLYSWGDCRAPSLCGAGWQAEESGDLICPEHSVPEGSLCHCPAPLLELNSSSCHGGKNNGPPCPGCGNPANPANGNKFERQSVYRGSNGFELSLSYNTDDDMAPVRFGNRWRDSFDRRVLSDPSNSMVAHRPDGKVLQFIPSGGGWVPGWAHDGTLHPDTNDRLTELLDPAGTRTGWQLAVAEGDELETYDAAGTLLSIRSRVGLTQTLTYSDGTNGPNGGFILDTNGQPTTVALPAGLLIRAADDFGRTLAFGYGMALRVVKLTDPAGGVYRFAYSTNLASITFPDNAVRTYTYNEPENTGGVGYLSALTGITDENGTRFATFQYGGDERITLTQHAGGAERYALSGNSVTDPLGTVRTYGFDLLFQAHRSTGFTGPACPGCGPALQTHDTNGNVASSTDWNGGVAQHSYDLTRNLETSRTEAFGTAQARTISTLWHPVFRLPIQISEPLRITSYTYNGNGGSCGLMADGATPVPGVPCSKTIQPTSDATGAAGFGATAAGTPRTWTYTYNANGQVATTDGPRTDASDVTTYAYYANDDPDPGKRGNVATIANALGHVTSITAYNAHGQPTTIVDPNGLTTTLAYDARQRLSSRSVGGELTTYTYDGVGQLTQVTLPDGSFLSYSYDPAHRFTGMSDNLGNRIAYSLDAMGNRTKEEVFDPASALAQTRSRVFNNLNQLYQEIGAQNQTTQYAYDNQGNATSVTDPLTRVTTNAYDALNRLVKVTDPNLGQTQYAYNGIDQLVSVTDPRNLATTYNYNGLANLNSQQSPDTGTTANTYDAAGNLLTQSDAKGQTTSYAYDALNRVSSITFADSSKQTYAYDQGVNGIGRLSSITETDPQNQVASLLAYAYDQHGRTLSETRTIGGVAYALAYSYDSSGRLSGMTYPSGRTIAYTFDALGRINQVSTTPPPAVGGATQIVASNVAYQPFGGVKSYALGNGQSYMRSYDLDGRIASYSLGAQSFALGYDTAGRVTFLQDIANALASNAYVYDALDRLTNAVLPAVDLTYGYDAVGNRISKSTGSATDSYAYGATSNRLASITPSSGTPRPFAFDANGSTATDGVNQYGYDARGRLVQSVGAAGITAYQVNALGQRIRKTNLNEDRVYLYDTRGRLIAETDPGGALKREYLYLNDIPVAVIQ